MENIQQNPSQPVQPMQPLQPLEPKRGVGAIIGAVAIVVVLLGAGIYFMKSMSGDVAVNTNQAMPTQQIAVGEPNPSGASGAETAFPERPAVDPNTTQGTGTDINDIEADLNKTDLNTITADLQAL